MPVDEATVVAWLAHGEYLVNEALAGVKLPETPDDGPLFDAACVYWFLNAIAAANANVHLRADETPIVMDAGMIRIAEPQVLAIFKRCKLYDRASSHYAGMRENQDGINMTTQMLPAVKGHRACAMLLVHLGDTFAVKIERHNLDGVNLEAAKHCWNWIFVRQTSGIDGDFYAARETMPISLQVNLHTLANRAAVLKDRSFRRTLLSSMFDSYSTVVGNDGAAAEHLGPDARRILKEAVAAELEDFAGRGSQRDQETVLLLRGFLRDLESLEEAIQGIYGLNGQSEEAMVDARCVPKGGECIITRDNLLGRTQRAAPAAWTAQTQAMPEMGRTDKEKTRKAPGQQALEHHGVGVASARPRSDLDVSAAPFARVAAPADSTVAFMAPHSPQPMDLSGTALPSIWQARANAADISPCESPRSTIKLPRRRQEGIQPLPMGASRRLQAQWEQSRAPPISGHLATPRRSPTKTPPKRLQHPVRATGYSPSHGSPSRGQRRRRPLAPHVPAAEEIKSP